MGAEPASYLKGLSSTFPEFERPRIRKFTICRVRTSQKGDMLGGLEMGSAHAGSCRVGDPSRGINSQKPGLMGEL